MRRKSTCIFVLSVKPSTVLKLPEWVPKIFTESFRGFKEILSHSPNPEPKGILPLSVIPPKV